MPGQLIESLRAAARLDLGKLRIVVSLRLAVGVTFPLSAGAAIDQTDLGVAGAIGAFIVGIADTGDTFPVRARVMSKTAVAITATTIVAGIVSPSTALIIAVSAAVAFVCGYAAAMGPHASLTGVLVLVVYCIYAGAPVGDDGALVQAAAVLAGGAFQLAIALSGWPLNRCAGVRGKIADAWRTFAVAADGEPADMLSATIPSSFVTAVADITICGVQGVTRDWLLGIVEAAGAARLPMASLAAHRDSIKSDPAAAEAEAALAEFSRAVSAGARGIAAALVVPWRKRAVPARIASADQAGVAAARFAPDQVSRIVAALHKAGDLLVGPYPIGRRCDIVRRRLPRQDVRSHLRAEWGWSSPIFRHALRLAVLIPIAWGVGFLVLPQHQYWVPLTVAWVTRPDYGTTVGRVAARVAGTLLGLVLVGVVIYVFDPGAAGMIAVCAVASFLLYAALPVNYAVAVIFITSLIVTLLEMVGDTLVTALWTRGTATLIGGALVVAASRIGPSYAAPGLAEQLATLAGAMRPYSSAVLHGTGSIEEASQPVIAARMKASAAVDGAKLEPRAPGMDPYTAERILNALLSCIFAVAAVESGDRSPAMLAASSPVAGAEAIDADALDADLHAVECELLRRAGDDSQPHLSPLDDPPPADPARAPVHRAWLYLCGDLRIN